MASVLPTLSVDSSTPSSSVHGGEGLTSFEEEAQRSQRSPSIVQKLIAELVGTFILIFIGCGTTFADHRITITPVGIALARGAVVTAMIYTLGHISGGHFNPAITLAYAASRQFPWKHVPLYVMVQMVGSVLASLALCWLFNGDQTVLTAPKISADNLHLAVWEIIISFILMWVMCGARLDPRANKELGGVAIGAAMTFNVLVAGKVTGASMNPARSVAFAVATRNISRMWLYILAPIIGTVTASNLYNFLRVPNDNQNKTNKLGRTCLGKSMELP